MKNPEYKKLLKVVQSQYESSRKLARDIWLLSDSDGDNNDRYFFECGFISGLNYNFDGSLRKDLQALEELSKLDQELGLD